MTNMKQNIYIQRASILVFSMAFSLFACSGKAEQRSAVVAPKTEVAVQEQPPVVQDPIKKKKTVNKKTVTGRKAGEAPKAAPKKQTATAKSNNNIKKATGKKRTATNKSKNNAARQKPVASKNKKAATSKKAKARQTDGSRYIALKTNLPFDALAVQNLALEVQVHKHVTIDFPVMWSISDIERKHALRTIAFQPEGRWWLKEAGTGHFFGLHAHVAWFNAKWDDTRYQTEKRPLAGAGISYGYKLPLSAHWGAEFNIGAGYANMKYNTFYNIENGARLDTRIRHYWGITRAGLSLIYRF